MWIRNRRVRAGGGLRAEVRAGAKGTEGAHAIIGSGATVVALSVIGVLGCAKAGVGATGRLRRGRRRRENAGEQADQHEQFLNSGHREVSMQRGHHRSQMQQGAGFLQPRYEVAVTQVVTGGVKNDSSGAAEIFNHI